MARSARTTPSQVICFVPNKIGYVRVLLLIASFFFMQTDPVVAMASEPAHPRYPCPRSHLPPQTMYFLSVAATPPPPCRAAPSPHRRRCRPSWTHLMDGCATRSPACLRAGAQARAGGAVAGPELAARRHAGEGAAVRHRRLRPCSLSGCACYRICSPIAWARRASGAPGGARPHLSPMARGAGLAMCVATFDAYRSVAP